MLFYYMWLQLFCEYSIVTLCVKRLSIVPKTHVYKFSHSAWDSIFYSSNVLDVLTTLDISKACVIASLKYLSIVSYVPLLEVVCHLFHISSSIDLLVSMYNLQISLHLVIPLYICWCSWPPLFPYILSLTHPHTADGSYTAW